MFVINIPLAPIKSRWNFDISHLWLRIL